MDERLEAIAKEMELLTTHDDPEKAHAQADDLLVDTIDKLMTKETSDVLLRILNSYTRVGKWYA